MTPTEHAILQALADLDAKIKTMHPAKSKPDLLPLFTRIDELTATLPGDSDPQLIHYLRKKSYEKARLWLLDRRPEIARGGCHGD